MHLKTLAQIVLSICLEKYGLYIIAHSLKYSPERRPVETTFDVEYTKSHRLEVQAIPASEILHTYVSPDTRVGSTSELHCSFIACIPQLYYNQIVTNNTSLHNNTEPVLMVTLMHNVSGFILPHV